MSAVLTLGLVRIGSVDLAIPGEVIDEVVRGPIEVAPLPHAPRHVLGAFALRGRPVPTIDLAALVRRAGAAPDRPVAFAMVLRHATGRLAIQVDEVLGVRRAASDEMTELESRTDGGLFSRIYTPAVGGRVAAVLDLDALLATEGVKSAALASVTEAGREAEEAKMRPLVLFRAGGACLGIEASHVREVQKRPGSLDSPFDSALVEGFQDFRGTNLPVVKLDRLLQLPVTEEFSAGRHLVFIQHDASAAALCVDEIVAIESIDVERLQPIESEAGERRGPYLGSYISPKQGVVLALDVATLLREIQCGGDGLAADEEGDRERTDSGDAAVRDHFLVYRCGGVTMATALTELEAVMELPSDQVMLGEGGQAVSGVCVRFGQPVQLIELAARFGLRSDSAASRIVLCLKTEVGIQGFVVERAESLQLAVPQKMPWRDAPARGGRPRFTHTIRVRTEEADRAACVVSLARLAERAA